MTIDGRVQKILTTAEAAIAALASEAAATRDYARAAQLLGLAQRIAVLGRTPEMKTPANAPSAASSIPPTGNGSGTEKSYPRFKRQDDTLIKVGWSKSDRTTYEHRSPRSVLNR